MKDIISEIQIHKDMGHKIMGCFPLYPPVEIFHSLDITPIILWNIKGLLENTYESDRHVQNYACSVSRCLLEFIFLNPKIFDGLYMYNACDTLRNLPEIIEYRLKSEQKEIPIFKMHIPVSLSNTKNCQEYLKTRIKNLINELEGYFSITFSNSKFQKSVKLYNEMKDIVNLIESYSAQGKIRYTDYLKICQKGSFLPVEKQIELFSDFAQIAEQNPVNYNSNCINIMISGIIPPPLAICEAMHRANLRIVKNDIACLNRFFGQKIEATDDPFKYYENYYFNHTPCTTIFNTSDKRLDYLFDIIEQMDIKGLVFIGEKFCEYEYLEFPFIEKSLKQRGIQSLFLEFSQEDDKNIASFITRIEAFSELYSK